MRGRKPKHFHPLLQKEKELLKTLHQTLPELRNCQFTFSRLVHPYGLPKTHKATLSIRPILSATETINYNLAKYMASRKAKAFFHKWVYDHWCLCLRWWHSYHSILKWRRHIGLLRRHSTFHKCAFRWDYQHLGQQSLHWWLVQQNLWPLFAIGSVL